MSIIYKYLIREIFKIFGIVLALVIGIYVFLDFIEKIDNFMEAGLPFSKAFIFFFPQYTLYYLSDYTYRHSFGCSRGFWIDE